MFTTLRLALCAGILAGAAATQTLTVTTSGPVPRIPGTPAIAGCQTVPEVFYFSVRGTISQAPSATQQIVLLVRPRRYDGSTIPGCTWVAQCQRGFVLPDNSFVVIAQFGTNGQQRTWFAGQQADLQYILVNRSTTVPTCVSDPNAISIAQSNIATVTLDPNTPALHDYQLPCGSSRMDVTGTPTPAQTLTFQIPNQGWIAFGAPSASGFPVANCTVYFGFAINPVLVSTDAMGQLQLPIPTMPNLIGADLGTQGILLQGGQLDLTNPTLAQIR